MWDIDWKTLFQNVWITEDMVDLPIIGCALQPASAIVKPWLTTWSKIVALISSDMRLCPWPLPLFCLCTLPPCILTPLLPLCCWPWSFSGSIVRICNSCVVLCLYMLSNWRFMKCIFELFQRTGLYGLIYILFISESQDSFTFAFTFMHLADAFIQSDLHCIQVTVLHFISSCFPWESNPWSWRC